MLYCGLGVVGGVGPAAVCGEGEGAVVFAAEAAGSGGDTLSLHDALPICERAAGRDVVGDNRNVFRDVAGGDAADHRRVVGAVDGDGDDLAVGAVEVGGGDV